MNVNKLFMGGLTVAVGFALFAVAVKATDRFAPDVSNFLLSPFNRV